jgi:hypothetical protein
MALEGSTEQAQFTDVVDLLVEKSYNRGNHGNDSGGASPVEGDERSVEAASWEESDELMPSGD